MPLSPIILVMVLAPAGTISQPAAWQFLDIHNRERAAAGAPALRWNDQLERDAAAHAQRIASTGQLVHAPREGRGAVRENIGKAPLGWGIDQLMQTWLDEKRHFVGGVYPDVCSGGWSVCAHYTQVIWPATTDVGCGMAAGGQFTWFVCRYSPGGNKDGRRLGVMADRLPRGTLGSKERQRLGTPGQTSHRSFIDIICNPTPQPQKPGEVEAMKQSTERRKQQKEEIDALVRAIKLLQAGLEEELDESALEQITGIRIGSVPSSEQIRILTARLKQLMEELVAEQERIEEILSELQERQHLRQILCEDR
jgi:hypothetical protein